MFEWVVAAPGKTLDSANWDELPTTRIAVNHAGCLVPDYTYWCAVDKIENLESVGYIPGKPRIMYTYGYTHGNRTYFWADEVVLVDYMPIGSFDLGVAFAINEGASKIYLVGSDRQGSESAALSVREVPNDYDKWCSRVLDRVYEICDAGGVEWVHV